MVSNLLVLAGAVIFLTCLAALTGALWAGLVAGAALVYLGYVHRTPATAPAAEGR